MQRFVDWALKGHYTPWGKAFDQGCTCMEAIYNYVMKADYTTCGKTGEWANGNGALMRIMPVCLYAYGQYKNKTVSLEKAVEYVHQVSALTHNHLRSKMACGIYFFMVMAILEEEGSLKEKLQKGMNAAQNFYRSDVLNLMEWVRYGRMTDLNEFAQVKEEEIKSSGYVVDTIEAAIWCLMNTHSYKECVLTAVNLGDDTDTVAAIAGGLAGALYGYDDIPQEWRDTLIKRKYIEEMCERACDCWEKKL